MREHLGISAILVALIALVARHGGETLPAPSYGGKEQPAASAAAADLEGPWLATRQSFHYGERLEAPKIDDTEVDFTTPLAVRDCALSGPTCRGALAKYFGINSPKNIQFLVAAIPDPMHSRVSLLTDSAIQAIQQGAAASEWEFATQWLPWVDTINPDEKDPDKRRAERETLRKQENQPGILVFRSARPATSPPLLDSFEARALVVFLVGETPTAGINSGQFQLARAYMRAINEPQEVRILGPTFSGSFYGMAQLLQQDNSTAWRVTAYRIRSGTATGSVNARRFEETFNALFQGHPSLDFRSAMAGTTDHFLYFKGALKDLGIRENQAVSLIEDESGFGNSASVTSDEGGIRVYRFPRDISHLRNSYRDAVTSSKPENGAPSPEIDFSIKDAERGEDSVPTFSGQQTALSQYGVVNRIANAIRRDNIRVVEISATNTLDMLFLAEFLKRQCPDARLVLTYPDVLLVQAAQSEPLAGTLVLTSYPLFSAASGWMDPEQKMRPLTFPEANSEGIYNAAVLLLSPESYLRARLADYQWGDLPHPPTWLLTLDHQGFLPMDVFPHNSSQEKYETWFQQVPVPGPPPAWNLTSAIRRWFLHVFGSAGTGSLNLPPPPRAWGLTSAFLGFAGLMFVGWIWWISANPTLEADDRFSYNPVRISEGNSRRSFIFFLLLILLLMEGVLLIPGLRWKSSPAFTIVTLLGSGSLFMCARVVARRLMPRRTTILLRKTLTAGAAVLIALWIASNFFWGDRSFFFALRARELRFGSSPIWPILAALATLALFAFVHLTRFYLVCCHEPKTVTDGIQIPLQQRMHDACEAFTGALKSALCFEFKLTAHSYWVVALGFVIVFAFLLFKVWSAMQSPDVGTFDLLAIPLQLLSVVVLLLTCANIHGLWESLQDFLAAMATLPIAGAFRPVDRAGADRPLWVQRVNLESVNVHIETIEHLEEITRLAKDWQGLQPWKPRDFDWVGLQSTCYRENVDELLNPPPHPPRKREDTFEKIRDIRNLSAFTTRGLFRMLTDVWLERPPSSLHETEGPGDTHVSQPPEPPDPLTRLSRLAECCVALHYSSFILYGIRQIQNLFLFLSCGFVLLIVSLDSYSVQAPRAVNRMLLLLFTIIGVSVVRCLAGLERDPILSRLAGSKPGKLNTDFYLKMATYGALPVLSLLASQFPSISGFLLSWVEPTLQAFK